ncbi:MAG: FecR domain-containing protein [Candidatus Rifleibacteriota bacterium]
MRLCLKSFLTSFASVLLFSGNCMAVDLSATEILNIEGRVEVKKGQEQAFKKLNRNLKLAGALKRLDSGDKVRTYNESTAEMALKETCILAVKEQSLFEVPQTLGQAAITQLKAQQGALLFKVISGSNFEVKTADVIAGVKGTLFELDIIDGFNTMLETPALELGTLTHGGTIVNVYRGEVELKHTTTGKSRRLKAGEAVTVFNNPAMALNRLFSEGFSLTRAIDPEALLAERFGAQAVEMLNVAPDLASLTGFSGVGSINAAIGEPAQRLSSMFQGCSDEIMQAIHINEVDACIDVIKDLKDEKYKADFSGYSPQQNSFSIDDRRFNEVYLGNKTFAACKASFGSQRARLEPSKEGIILNEGNGTFRVIKFNGNTPDLEFIASHYESQGQHVTTINLIKGELFARIPGELEYFKVPAGSVSFMAGAAKGSWASANAQSLDPAAQTYAFKVLEKISKERKEVDKRNTQKKVNAVKKIINFKKFGF